MPSFNFSGMENNKSKFARTVEIATNLSIIAVAIVGATVLVKNYLLRPNTPTSVETRQLDRNSPGSPENSRRSAPTGPAAGTQISLSGINWTDSEETVVIALSNKCRFCTDSAPFYQRLTNELADRKNVRVVAVFPHEVGEGKKYLDGLNVPITEMTQAQLDSFGVRGTPTLMIVDKSGKVKQSWVGRLSAEKEAEVLSRVKA